LGITKTSFYEKSPAYQRDHSFVHNYG